VGGEGGEPPPPPGGGGGGVPPPGAGGGGRLGASVRLRMRAAVAMAAAPTYGKELGEARS